METISNIQTYLALITTAMLVAVAIIGIILFYLLKIKKITAKEEKIDYSKFVKRDVLSYLRFDDVIEAGTDDNKFGIICHGKVYTAGIDITGYNFAEATIEEQESTMMKAIAFANIIKDDVQLRQTVTAINLSENIEEYNKIFHELILKSEELSQRYENNLRLKEDYIDDDEIYLQLDKETQEIRREIDTTKLLSDEAAILIKFMGYSTENETHKTYQMLFSYVFNDADFTETPDKEAIVLRAKQELQVKAASYSKALERCGCKCHNLSASELVGSCYDYFHPNNNNTERFDDKIAGTIDTLYVTSDSIEKIKKQKMEEQEFLKLMETLHRQQQEAIRKNELEFTREIRQTYIENGEQPPEDK